MKSSSSSGPAPSMAERLGIPGLLLIGAVWPLAGMLAGPGHIVIGEPQSDAGKHVWAFWHSLAQLGAGEWPRTELMAAPFGGLHLDVMLLPAILMAPLSILGSPTLAANAWLVLTLLGVGLATHALCRQLVDSPWGACAAGLLAQTSPYLLGYPLTSGVYERAAVWVFPLVLLCLLRRREGAGHRWSVLAMAGLLLAVLGCQVYGIFTVVMILLAAPLLLGGTVGATTALRRLLPTGLGLALVLIGIFLLCRGIVEDPWSMSPQFGRTQLTLGNHSALETTQWSDLLDPFTVQDSTAKEDGDRLYTFSYIGWVPLLTGILGAALVRGPRRRAVRWVVGIALLVALLSLGPHISLGSAELPNLPCLLMIWLVPLYGNTPPFWQQIGAVGPLLGVGLAALVARAPTPRARLGLAIGLVAAGLLERVVVMPVSPVIATSHGPPTALYAQIEGPGSVAEVPRVWRGGSMARSTAFLGQLHHRQPSQLAINVGNSPWDHFAPLLHAQANRWSEVVSCLRQTGYRWLVLHIDALDARIDHQTLINRISAVAGAPLAQEDGVLLYDLARTGEISTPPELSVEAGKTLYKADIISMLDLDTGQDCPVPNLRLEQPLRRQSRPGFRSTHKQDSDRIKRLETADPQ